MFSSKTLRMLAVAVGVTVCTAASHAAVIGITAESYVAGPRISSGDLSKTINDWDLNGGNAVVVMFAAENGIDVGATFGGQALTMLEIHDGVRHVASIGYLINPLASTGDVVITATRPASRISHAYAILSLSNVGSLADDASRTSAGALGYTTDTDGGFVLVAAENNNYSGPAPTVSGGNIDAVPFSQAVDGNCAIAFAHGDVATAGSYNVTVGGSVSAAQLVAFNPIPEPASLALLGLGGLFMIRRGKA
jgi:hypothetical protein